MKFGFFTTGCYSEVPENATRRRQGHFATSFEVMIEVDEALLSPAAKLMVQHVTSFFDRGDDLQPRLGVKHRRPTVEEGAAAIASERPDIAARVLRTAGQIRDMYGDMAGGDVVTENYWPMALRRNEKPEDYLNRIAATPGLHVRSGLHQPWIAIGDGVAVEPSSFVAKSRWAHMLRVTSGMAFAA